MIDRFDRWLALALLTTMILLVAVVLTSCGPNFGTNFAACEIGTLPAKAASLLPDVKHVLEGENVNWEAELTTLGVSAGVDAVTCAARAATLEAGRGGVARTVAHQRRVERGKSWLAKRGITL